MNKLVRRTLLGIPVVFVVMQFVPVARSNPPVETEVSAPPGVRAVLRRACYDCHSNQTVWPWYARVAPASWLVARDVQEGREELNFSAWNRLTTKEQARKLKETWKEVAEGEMPPWSYRIVHGDAVLSAQDQATLREWVLHGTVEPEKWER